MRLLLGSWLLIAIWIAQARCNRASCAAGCQLALSHVTFPDVDPRLGYYPNQCGSRIRITSVYSCMRLYCSPSDISPGVSQLEHECMLWGKISLPPFSIIDNITDEDISHFRQVSQAEFHGINLDVLAIPSRPLYMAAFRTQDAWDNSVSLRYNYGNAMFYFWAIVVAIGLGNRLLHSRKVLPFTSNYEKAVRLVPGEGSRFNRLTKRFVAVPALFSRHCSEPVGWCTIPPRLQSAILLVFTVINIVLCCVNYDVFDGNLYWPTSAQWCRYIGDRTGVISTANLPLIWLFATRNNLILYFTGWSFDTSMQFHRWVARISTIEAVVHSIAYTLSAVVGGSWQHYWKMWTKQYWVNGVLATVVMSFLCGFSLYPIRVRWYETFLILHIALAVLTLVGMWYHVEIFLGEYNGYLWPCIIIWLLDRMARIHRLLRLNFPFRLSSACYEVDSDVVWLSVPTAGARKPQPGEYYFLYVLHGLTFYENHPFTLSSWEYPARISSSHAGKPNLLFVVRPYDGVTSQLRGLAKNALMGTGNSSKSRRVRVLMEGPYGPRHDLKSFDSLVFVVGGTGISVALAYLTDLVEHLRTGQSSPYQTSHFRIVWAVRDYPFFLDLYEREIKPRMEIIGEANSTGLDIRFTLDIYITGPRPQTPLRDSIIRISHDYTTNISASIPIIEQHGEEDEEEESRPLIHQAESHDDSQAGIEKHQYRNTSTDIDDDKAQLQQNSTESSPLLSPTTSSPSTRCATPADRPSSNHSPADASHSSAASPSRPISPETRSPWSEPTNPPNTTINVAYSRPNIDSIIHSASRREHCSQQSRHTRFRRPGYNCIIAQQHSESTENLNTDDDERVATDAGRMAVVSCGPPGLADATRAAVVSALGDEECGDMEFYSESYAW